MALTGNTMYNIGILFLKWGQNFTKKLFDRQTPALTKQKSIFSTDSMISDESTWSLLSGT